MLGASWSARRRPSTANAGVGHEDRAQEQFGRVLCYRVVSPGSAGSAGLSTSSNTRMREKPITRGSGRAMARSGLRMMPTFPSPSLKFRTVSYPQYGFRAGISKRGLPFRTSASVGLASSCAPSAACVDSPFCAGERFALEHFRSSRYCCSTPGALAPVWFVLSTPSSLDRPHPSHSQAHLDFTAPRLIRHVFAVRHRLGDPRVVPGFPCPSFLTCRPLRPRGDRNRFVPDLRSQPRPSSCYERLGSPNYPAIRFKQGRHFGASWFAFATACQVACLLCGSDQVSGHRGFYFQAFDESVTLLAAGHNYGSFWTLLPIGLSPIGVTASLAAP